MTGIDFANLARQDEVIRWVSTYFDDLGFRRVHVQHIPSILAACEDPETLVTHRIGGKLFPLPQTGQMHLEELLLRYPHERGYYCITTSYRDEPHPITGRHKRSFPMVEFETHGNIEGLRIIEQELLEALGLGSRDRYHQISYAQATNLLGASEIGPAEEKRLGKQLGNVVFLEQFPERTAPFWNMRRSPDGTANKIDVLLCGMETIGSAERSTDPDEMREKFHTINGGRYANRLFKLFGRKRVIAELEPFLALPFTPRFGGGIGIDRLIRGLESMTAA